MEVTITIGTRVKKSETRSAKSTAVKYVPNEIVTLDYGFHQLSANGKTIVMYEFGTVIEMSEGRTRVKWDFQGTRTWIKTDRLSII